MTESEAQQNALTLTKENSILQQQTPTTPYCIIPTGNLQDIWWQIYFSSILVGSEVCSHMHKHIFEYGFAFCFTRALADTYINKLMEHLIYCCKMPQDRTMDLIKIKDVVRVKPCPQDPVFVTYCSSQKILEYWRDICLTSPKKILCKNSMHHPGCIICIEQKYLFYNISSKKDYMSQRSKKGGEKEYPLLLSFLMTQQEFLSFKFSHIWTLQDLGPLTQREHTFVRGNAKLPLNDCLNFPPGHIGLFYPGNSNQDGKSLAFFCRY